MTGSDRWVRPILVAAIISNAALALRAVWFRVNTEPPYVPDPLVGVVALFAVLALPAVFGGVALARRNPEPLISAALLAAFFSLSYVTLPLLLVAVLYVAPFAVSARGVANTRRRAFAAMLLPAALGFAASILLFATSETVYFSLRTPGGFAEGTQGGVITIDGAVTALSMIALAAATAAWLTTPHRATERA